LIDNTSKGRRGVVRKPVSPCKVQRLRDKSVVIVDGLRHRVVFVRRAKCRQAPWLVVVRGRKEIAVTADMVKLVSEKNKK